MPLLQLKTNHPIDQSVSEQLLKRCSEVVSEALGKPERYVMVTIEGGLNMSFAGKTSPCAYLELKSIGLPETKTGELSSSLSSMVSTELTIPADRIYIEFADAQRHMWGWNGGTF